MMKDLLFVSALRGQHGTGIYQAFVSRTKNHSKELLVKSKSEASYFLWWNSYGKDEGSSQEILEDVMSNVIIGHVRYATKGNISNENAHPFDVGSIVGAHNGTLVDTRYQSSDKTDSELLFEDIQERGTVKVLSDLDEKSAYVITLLNKKTGEFSIASNGLRPICYTINKKRRVLYWASEKGALEWCAKRNHVEIGTIYNLTTDVVYRFHPLAVNADKHPDWEIDKITKKQPIGFIRHTPKYDNPIGSNILPWIPPDSNKKEENLTLLLQPPDLLAPLNLNIRRKRAQKPKVESNCIYCQRTMNLIDQFEGVQVDETAYSCKDCEELNIEVAKEIKQNQIG